MSEFYLNDVVRLKSGGPRMTIESFDDADGIVCVWFDDEKEIKRKTFPPGDLEHALP